MKSKAIFLALLALAFAAQARVVTRSEAASAVRAWTRSGEALGARFGASVDADKVKTFVVTNGVSFYAVPVDGGGTVFTSGDTESEPIVAFTSENVAELDPESPLYNLLCRDAEFRAKLAELRAVAATASSSAKTTLSSAAPKTSGDSGSSASRKWAALLGESSGSSRTKLSAAPIEDVKEISDLRVAPLLTTKWSQSTSNGMNCYNYYTPKNYVCGCTATAVSQVMRYFKYPENTVKQTFKCTVNDNPAELEIIDGPYDWDNMADSPKTEEEREAVGHLTYNVAIALKSMFSNGATSAYPKDIPGVLSGTFGYKNVVGYYDSSTVANNGGKLHEDEFRSRVIYPNLDAGLPVLLSIRGYPKVNGELDKSDGDEGHAVVADGYGFTEVEGEQTAYVHVNLGWGGTDTAWYNLPDVDTASAGATAGHESGFDFCFLCGATFNISTEDEDIGLEILSGRVLDDENVPVVGATVDVLNDNGDVVASAVTDAKGIYAVRVPGNKRYSLLVSDENYTLEPETVIVVGKTTEGAGGMIYESNKVGNYWGADVVFYEPTVCIGEKSFSNLSLALAHAEDGDTLEILAPTVLKRDVVIDKSLTIVTRGDAASANITRRNDAMFTVAAGATLTLSNVVFAAGEGTVAAVEAGGHLELVDLAKFGLDPVVVAIRTARADGLKLCGAIDTGFTFICASAKNEGDVFGYADANVDADALANSLAHIVNAVDGLGELRGMSREDGSVCELYWADVPVPVDDAVAYFVDADGVTNTAARVDRLLEKFEAAREDGTLGDSNTIVICKDGELSRRTTVSSDLVLVANLPEQRTLKVASTAGFDVTSGKLSITGIKFEDYKGAKSFITVNGDDAELAIGDWTEFNNVENTGGDGGAICIKKGGAASINNGQFIGCKSKRNGGAVSLESGASLSIKYGEFTGCTAGSFGGAIYAKGEVALSGYITIEGNASKNSESDNLYLSGASASLKLTDSVRGSVGVRWIGMSGYGNFDGNKVAVADCENTDDVSDVLHGSAAAFFSDYDSTLKAEPDDEAGVLCWSAEPVGPQPCSPALAGASVDYADGSVEHYVLLSEAIAALTDDATIVVLKNKGNHITKDVEIAYNVTLVATNEDVWIDRQANCSFVIGEGASLSVSNLTVYGCGYVLNEENDYELDYQPCTVPLFDVNGGSLTLQDGAVIKGVRGDEKRNAGAVSVWSDGVFTIESGALICDCENSFVDVSTGAGRGGAVLVDNGTANLLGGTITDCRANNGGGVFIGNGARLNVAGDMTITDNYRLDGTTPNNLVVYDMGQLVLTDALTGTIGYTEGVSGNELKFGQLAESFPAESNATASARNFTHDTNGDVGAAVASADKTLLVWGSAVSMDRTFTDDDEVEYTFVSETEEVDGQVTEKLVAIPLPAAVDGLIYNGKEQVGVAGIGCVLEGETAVNAGEYVATATLLPGYEWAGFADDEKSTPKEITWSIAKAAYDMRGIKLADKTVTYDGKAHPLKIAGSLPFGVTVAYSGNDNVEVGKWMVIATFTGDAENYEPILDLTATLTIVDPNAEEEDPAEDPETPPEEEDPPTQVNVPGPISFKAIIPVGENEWTLIITNRTPLCDYRLLWTDDLSKGFTSTGEWERAAADVDPVWTTNIISDTSAKFWMVEPRETVTPVAK